MVYFVASCIFVWLSYIDTDVRILVNNIIPYAICNYAEFHFMLICSKSFSNCLTQWSYLYKNPKVRVMDPFFEKVCRLGFVLGSVLVVCNCNFFLIKTNYIVEKYSEKLNIFYFFIHQLSFLNILCILYTLKLSPPLPLPPPLKKRAHQKIWLHLKMELQCDSAQKNFSTHKNDSTYKTYFALKCNFFL